MMSTWCRTSTLGPDQRLAVLDLCNRTEVALGREAIDEGRRRAVVHGWNAEHWLAYSNERLDGYAHLSGVATPSLEMCGGGFDPDLADAILESHPQVDWWLRGTPAPESGTTIRTLQLMGVCLPVPVLDIPDGATLRIFEPERDETQWLEQNNAAFAHHPEQGAWRHEDLAERTHEPWFDPSGFLLLEINGRLAASCWTKVHELHPDRLGEIYVVSVHPDFQGRHLGRVMVTQGLATLRKKGVANAVLFVDESNGSARQLYESLGFAVDREDNLVRFERPIHPRRDPRQK